MPQRSYAQMRYPFYWKRQMPANSSALTCRPGEAGGSNEQSTRITAADVIAAYIEAKDRNHLQLLERVFVEGDCEIEYSDKTHLVSLPSRPKGLERISQFMANFGD